MADTDIVQVIAEARIDARSLSEFVFKPADFMVARRLAPSVRTLQYYVDFFNTMQSNIATSVSAAQSSLNSSVAEAEGKVAYIETTVQDAINNTAVEGGILADTFVTATAYGSGSIARTQREINAERVSVHDFGAIGDGTLHTIQEWIDNGRYSSLAEIQADYPHVTALTDSIDWAAIQACINYCNSTDKTAMGVAGKNYIIDKTVVIRSNAEFNYSTFSISKDYAGAAVYIGDNPDSPVLMLHKRIKLPTITSDRSYLVPWVVGSVGVKLEGVRNTVIEFNNITKFETNFLLYSNNGPIYTTSNIFNFNGILASSRTNVHILVESTGWINQCRWNGGHFAVFSEDSTRHTDIKNIHMQKIGQVGNNPPNAHTFSGCNMEGGGFEYTILQDYDGKATAFLSNNIWDKCRFEAAKKMHFESSQVNDTLLGCHFDENTQFTGKIPTIIGQYNRGNVAVFAGLRKGTTRNPTRTMHTYGGTSGTSYLVTYAPSSSEINSAISGSGTYSVFNGSDSSLLYPVLEIGKEPFYPSLSMGDGVTQATERLLRKGLNSWEFNFNLYPTTTNTYSLGAPQQRLKAVYTEHLSTNRLSAWGAVAPTSKPVLSGMKNPTTVEEQKVVIDSLINILVSYGLMGDNRT